MRKKKAVTLKLPGRGRLLRVGFLPVNDCAPIVVAQEFGFFEKYGLTVELRRQPSWREVHDKLIYQELEASHAPAALPYLINLGVTPSKWPCVTGMVLSLQGSAITISRSLWDDGARDAATVGERIWRDRGKKTYAFAVDMPFSAEYFLLCQWLRSAGLAPLSQVRILKVPPSEMFPMLKLGYLDGFCVGEPWSSLATQARAGVCVGTSAALAPMHPDKILLVREDFARRRAEEHEKLIAALLEACAYCDNPENREDICALLSQPQYVNAPRECILAGFNGSVEPQESRMRLLRGLSVFSAQSANDPTSARAGWIAGHLHRFFRWRTRPLWMNEIFRREIYRRAKKLAAQNMESREKRSESPVKRTGCLA